MLRLALRSALERRRRFVATLSAVALAVSFMSGALIFSDTLRASFTDLVATANEGTDAVVRSTETVEGFFTEERASIDDDVVDVVGALDSVAEVAGGLDNRFATIVGADGDALGGGELGAPTFLFAWSDATSLNPFLIEEGRAPAGPDEVVVNQSAVDQGDLVVGGPVTVIAADEAETFTLVGVASFAGQGSAAGSTAAIFDLPTAQEILGQPGRVDSVSVHAVDGVDEQQLRNEVAAALRSAEVADVEVLTGTEFREEQERDITVGLSGFRTFLLVFAGVTLFVGSFIIYNTFTILLTQRTRELALLRAIGAARRQVLGSVLAEAAVVGVVASAAGLVLGLGTATLIRSLFLALGVDLPGRSLVLTGGTIQASVLTGLVVTLASTVLPAFRASRVPPLAALRDASIDESGTSRLRALIGLVVTGLGAASLLFGLFSAERNEGVFVGGGAGITFLGVVILGPVLAVPVCRALGWPLPRVWGVSGELAVQNATRNPRRTAGTAAALMIGVGIVSLITIFAASVRETIRTSIAEQFRGDFVVDSGAFGAGGLPTALGEELAALPEVSAAAPVRFALVEVDDNGQLALGIDPEPLSHIFDLEVAEGDLATMQPGEVAVSLSTLRFHGWSMGETIELGFVETGPQPFTIVAVTSGGALADAEGEESGLDFTLHNDDLDANVPQSFDLLVYVQLADGVSPEDGLAAVEAVTEPYPTAEVLDLAGYQARQTAIINQLLGLIFGLLALAIVVALIGIANTLSLSIVERTRELGLLRAVGTTRVQLKRTVRGEAIVMAVFGTVLGLGIGVFFGVSMVQSLTDDGLTLTIPVLQLLVIAGLGVLAGVLSSVLPARRVSRIDVLAAIGSE